MRIEPPVGSIYIADYPKDGPKLSSIALKPQGQTVTVSEKELLRVLEKANRAMPYENTSLQYSIHRETGTIMVKVINSETQELVREVPPEKILDMVAAIWDMAGIMIDERI